MTSKVTYLGGLRTENIHIQSDAKTCKILEHTAQTSPVHYSLHPDIEKVVTFNWK